MAKVNNGALLAPKLDMATGPVTVTCRLTAGSASDKVTTTVPAAGGSSCNMQTAYELAAAGAATLTIDTPTPSSVSGGDAKITAIRVGSLQSSEVTPRVSTLRLRTTLTLRPSGRS